MYNINEVQGKLPHSRSNLLGLILFHIKDNYYIVTFPLVKVKVLDNWIQTTLSMELFLYVIKNKKKKDKYNFGPCSLGFQ